MQKTSSPTKTSEEEKFDCLCTERELLTEIPRQLTGSQEKCCACDHPLLEMIGQNEKNDLTELANLPPNLTTCKAKMDYLNPFFFMMWDGMSFFSTNGFHKLKRIADETSVKKWYDQFLSPRAVVLGSMYLIVLFCVFFFEFKTYN